MRELILDGVRYRLVEISKEKKRYVTPKVTTKKFPECHNSWRVIPRGYVFCNLDMPNHPQGYKCTKCGRVIEVYYHYLFDVEKNVVYSDEKVADDKGRKVNIFLDKNWKEDIHNV